MTQPNPNPSLITDEMWWLWLHMAGIIPGVRLGGIYAFKPGYHSKVLDNQANWPKDYSIRLPLDLTQPDDKARAIDFTMSTAEMILRTGYLKAAAEHPDDDRLYGLREFIGTLDGVTVLRMYKNTIDGPWFYSTSDLSHTWHNHDSFFTEFCDDMKAMQAFASAFSGQSWEDWIEGDDMPLSDEDIEKIAKAVWARAEAAYVHNASSVPYAMAGGLDEAEIMSAWNDPVHGPPGSMYKIPLAPYWKRVGGSGGGSGGGPVDLTPEAIAEVEAAAFRGAQRAEDA
jgi:hypothetical protein